MNEIDKLSQLPTSGNITTDIRTILSEARKSTVRAINTTMTVAYWLIGKRIVEEYELLMNTLQMT